METGDSVITFGVRGQIHRAGKSDRRGCAAKPSSCNFVHLISHSTRLIQMGPWTTTESACPPWWHARTVQNDTVQNDTGMAGAKRDRMRVARADGSRGDVLSETYHFEKRATFKAGSIALCT